MSGDTKWLNDYLREIDKVIRSVGQDKYNEMVNRVGPPILGPDGKIYWHVGSPEKPIWTAVQRSVAEPKNNDGRSSCYWCHSSTRQVGGVTSVYDICSNCGR